MVHGEGVSFLISSELQSVSFTLSSVVGAFWSRATLDNPSFVRGGFCRPLACEHDCFTCLEITFALVLDESTILARDFFFIETNYV